LNIAGSPSALKQIHAAAKLRLFLDYDGTLAEFARTPDDIHPDPELIDLLERLKNHHRFQIAVISGRRLSHIRSLIPIPGILLAGTYGIELWEPSGTRIDRLEFDSIRPVLDRIKPHWKELIRPYPNFYLEDKGWTLALHAKFVDPEIAEDTLNEARRIIDQDEVTPDLFRILGGYKFLEIAPKLANKGLTVQYLISRYPLEGALPIYLGDDDKDEEAFEVIKQDAGIAILVSETKKESAALLRLTNPECARHWLKSLIT
jgi:trehalose 6-phosphate phosphatase